MKLSQCPTWNKINFRDRGGATKNVSSLRPMPTMFWRIELTSMFWSPHDSTELDLTAKHFTEQVHSSTDAHDVKKSPPMSCVQCFGLLMIQWIGPNGKTSQLLDRCPRCSGVSTIGWSAGTLFRLFGMPVSHVSHDCSFQYTSFL